MARHRHAVQYSENGIVDERRQRRNGRERHRIGHIDLGDNALRSNIHDLLDTGQTGGGSFDDHSDRRDGKSRQNGVIGNVINPSPTDDCAARTGDRTRDACFVGCRRFGVRPKYDLYLQRHLLIVRLAKDLLTEGGRVDGLNPILWTPRPQVAKTGEHVTPRGMAVRQNPSGDPGLPEAFDLA
jgi:hypothetical protein